MQETSSPAARDEALLLRAWPGGVPPAEGALWITLPDDGRELARKRLGALLSYEDSGNWARRAREAELSKPRFFSLLHAWRQERSLASIVPGARARRGHGAGGSASRGVREAVAKLVRSEPGLSKEAMTRRLLAELDDAPAATTIRHLVDAERALARRESLGCDNGFGRHVSVDCCPAFLRRSGGDNAIGTIIGVSIDQATGLILGSATGRNGLAVVSAAARNASAYVSGLSMETVGNKTPVLEVILAPSLDARSSLLEARRVSGLGNNIRLEEARRDRPVGARLLEVFGPAIGKVDLRPRAALTFSTLEGRDLDMSDDMVVKAYLDTEITRHNQIILDRTPRAAVSLERLAHDLMLIAG